VSDWRDQFTEPRCGHVLIIGGKKVEHRYLTDYGYVSLDGPQEEDAAFLPFLAKVRSDDFQKRVKAFAREKWEAGEDGPFKWTGEL
jgi:hypothetical protein